ncbi:hypothetical protein M5X11_20080, partial [Paenibacillus alginolyticus]|nr:hypothetical protein [Paenibacillus alginolyticus]
MIHEAIKRRGDNIITLSGYGDEIADDLETQLDVLASEGIRDLDLRSVWSKNVLELSDEEIVHIKPRFRTVNN